MHTVRTVRQDASQSEEDHDPTYCKWPVCITPAACGVPSMLAKGFVYAEPYIQISTESAKSADLVV